MERKEIFRRDIEIKAYWEDEEKILVEGRLSDSYHEMTANVKFSFPKLEILEVQCKFIRYPHDECLLAMNYIKDIEGLRVGKDFYKLLMEKIGGPKGCVHLNNLIYEIGMSAVQGRFAKWDEMAPSDFSSLPKPKRIKLYLQFMPGLKNGCSAWGETSPMVKRALEESD